MEKLNVNSKILLATGQINYLANTIYEFKQFLEKVNKEKESNEVTQFLEESLKDLANVMEKMGYYLNNNDLVLPIDINITSVPFNIVVRGDDNLYQEENI